MKLRLLGSKIFKPKRPRFFVRFVQRLSSAEEKRQVVESEFYRRRETRVNVFRHLAVLSPSRHCLNSTAVIILVHSHPAYRSRRDAVRETWSSAVHSGRWPAPPGLSYESTIGPLLHTIGFARNPHSLENSLFVPLLSLFFTFLPHFFP